MTSKLLKDVRVDRPNPNYANLIQEQLGGPQGELKAAMQYLSQSFRIKDPRKKDLFLDIASEELGHMEMVATMVNLLNGHQVDAQNTTVGSVEASTLTGLTPMLANSSGFPFTGAYVNETGDLAADILSDIAAEQRAKVVYQYLYRQINDSGVKETIDFLLNREEAHNTLFGRRSICLRKRVPSAAGGHPGFGNSNSTFQTGQVLDANNLTNPKPPKFNVPNQQNTQNPSFCPLKLNELEL
jgi:Mn-containing catalase